jgi:hypothetical protein
MAGVAVVRRGTRAPVTIASVPVAAGVVDGTCGRLTQSCKEQAAASVRCMLLCTSIACACTNYNTGLVRMRDHVHYTLGFCALWHHFAWSVVRGASERAHERQCQFGQCGATHMRYGLLAGTYFVFEVCEYSFLS